MHQRNILFMVCAGLACAVPVDAAGHPEWTARAVSAKAVWRIENTADFNFLKTARGIQGDLPPNALEFENDRADDPKAWRRHGLKLFNQGRYEEALTAFNQAIILKGNDAETWNNKGAALAKLERYDEALTAYDTAIEFRPNFGMAWHNKGMALSKLKRTLDALEAFEEVLRINPTDPEAWKNKSAALAVLGRYFEALGAINEALNYAPHFAEALELKAELEDKIKSMRFQL